MGFITESLFSNQSCNVSQKGVKQVTGNPHNGTTIQKISLKTHISSLTEMKKKKSLAEKNKKLQDNMNCKNLTLLTIDVMYTYILIRTRVRKRILHV